MNRERRLEIKDEPAGREEREGEREGGREGEGERGREGGRGRERGREGGERQGGEGREGEREREKNESVNCKVHVEQNERRQKGERHKLCTCTLPGASACFLGVSVLSL